MSTPLPSPQPRSKLLPTLLILLLIGGGIAAYVFWPKPPVKPPEDMAGAMAANLRGIGHMEQYKYAKAEKEFEEAARLAPDWLPARINLGIALFNEDKAEPLARSRQIFDEILAVDPDNKHAHYCLGIISSERGPYAAAYGHFLAVNKLDDKDAHTWYRLGSVHPDGTRSESAKSCFEKALAINPNLNSARYNLSQCLFATDPARAKPLSEEHKALQDHQWEDEATIRYGAMGKYADVIGRDPKVMSAPNVGPVPLFELPGDFKITLATGAKWATSNDLGTIGAAQRDRFGGTIVLFDFNRDGRPDILLLSAVLQNGKVRDLLLRNDGNHAFTDVTAEAGLGGTAASRGAAAGDYDNDGFPDLVITTSQGPKLYRNRRDGQFEDVSTTAGFNKLTASCLACSWVDLDQDGDLDLLIASSSGVVLFENIGVAPPSAGNAPPPGLTTAFRPDKRFEPYAPAGECTGFVISDLDADRDLDVLVLPAQGDPTFIANDRLMRFHRADMPLLSKVGRTFTGGLVLDANRDERSDLFLVSNDGMPIYLLSSGEHDFAPGRTNSPKLKQAVAVDLDMDGWPDVVGLSEDGKAIFLHNRGDGRLEVEPDAFGAADQLPAGIRALACAELDGDCAPDLLLWSDAGLQLRRSLGNGNKSLFIDPSGRRDKGNDERTNADGFGCWILAHAGMHWAGAERATISAGLGQSLLPTALGLGKAGQADLVRIRWPDTAIQAEFGVNACVISRIQETNRKGTSCPVLMTWDGERFIFVTDFLGAGAMGELGPDGSVRPPRGEESIKIEAGQLKPKDGRYLLKVAEPMDEVLYLDRVRLDVIDHPASVFVYPDERFATADPQPTQELLAFKNRFLPRSATDHNGRNVTKAILDRDRRAVDGFVLRSWLGYAEDHSLTLDFGELAETESGGRWFLVLAGWTEYAYPESIYAATRAGVPMNVPVLERLAEDGKTWKTLGELGFPAGLPRVMTCPMPNLATGGKCVLRIRTNMQVYWDHVYLAPAEEFGSVAKLTSLNPMSAGIAHRGFMQEILPDGRAPIAYDDAKTELVSVSKWKGNLTRHGDVTELLRQADDRFVICGPGDEITVRFDAGKLPDLPKDWQRSFVLRSWGYCKDVSPTTATGGVVGPLPFRAMPNYPDFGSVKPPMTDADRWHTRPASGK